MERVQHCCLVRSLQHPGGTSAVELLAVGGGDVNECGYLFVRLDRFEESVNKRRLRRPLRSSGKWLVGWLVGRRDIGVTVTRDISYLFGAFSLKCCRVLKPFFAKRCRLLQPFFSFPIAR